MAAPVTRERITSPHNDRLKNIAALRDKRERDKTGLMLVDGFDEICLAHLSGAHIETLVMCPPLITEAQFAQSAALQNNSRAIIEVSETAYKKVAYREDPDGWLAICKKPNASLDQLKLSSTPVVLLVESVEKPGNLGAMLRTADACGVDALISCDGRTDLTNPNVVRASKGCVFGVPFAESNTSRTLDWLKSRGIQLVAATPAATQDFTQVDLRQPIAIAVGEERNGLSDTLLNAADIQVRIPMHGRVNSLNVSVSAAVLMYEAVKQRNSVIRNK